MKSKVNPTLSPAESHTILREFSENLRRLGLATKRGEEGMNERTFCGVMAALAVTLSKVRRNAQE